MLPSIWLITSAIRLELVLGRRYWEGESTKRGKPGWVIFFAVGCSRWSAIKRWEYRWLIRASQDLPVFLPFVVSLCTIPGSVVRRLPSPKYLLYSDNPSWTKDDKYIVYTPSIHNQPTPLFLRGLLSQPPSNCDHWLVHSTLRWNLSPLKCYPLSFLFVFF